MVKVRQCIMLVNAVDQACVFQRVGTI